MKNDACATVRKLSICWNQITNVKTCGKDEILFDYTIFRMPATYIYIRVYTKEYVLPKNQSLHVGEKYNYYFVGINVLSVIQNNDWGIFVTLDFCDIFAKYASTS